MTHPLFSINSQPVTAHAYEDSLQLEIYGFIHGVARDQLPQGVSRVFFEQDDLQTQIEYRTYSDFNTLRIMFQTLIVQNGLRCGVTFHEVAFSSTSRSCEYEMAGEAARLIRYWVQFFTNEHLLLKKRGFGCKTMYMSYSFRLDDLFLAEIFRDARSDGFDGCNTQISFYTRDIYRYTYSYANPDIFRVLAEALCQKTYESARSIKTSPGSKMPPYNEFVIQLPPALREILITNGDQLPL